jgi:hypothetical protein
MLTFVIISSSIHHVREGLGVLNCSLIPQINLVLPSLPRSSYASSPFGLYCNACFGILSVTTFCTYCSHFCWYSFSILSVSILCTFWSHYFWYRFGILSVSKLCTCCSHCFWYWFGILSVSILCTYCSYSF